MACAFRDSGGKETGISPATTPMRYSSMFHSVVCPPANTVTVLPPSCRISRPDWVSGGGVVFFCMMKKGMA